MPFIKRPLVQWVIVVGSSVGIIINSLVPHSIIPWRLGFLLFIPLVVFSLFGNQEAPVEEITPSKKNPN